MLCSSASTPIAFACCVGAAKRAARFLAGVPDASLSFLGALSVDPDYELCSNPIRLFPWPTVGFATAIAIYELKELAPRVKAARVCAETARALLLEDTQPLAV